MELLLFAILGSLVWGFSDMSHKLTRLTDVTGENKLVRTLAGYEED